MYSHQTLTSWSHLPEGIIHDIFCRLPVKPLAKSKCVCKTWNSIICNPYFINLHVSRSPKFHNPDIIFSATGLHIIQNIGIKNQEVIKPITTLPPHISHLEIVNSCNGLLCLNDLHDSVWDDVISVYVCNPYTGENVKLPCESSIQFKPEKVLYGFGYDNVRSEYKVVRLVFHSMKTCEADCIADGEVCTLGSSSWRRVGEASFHPSSTGHAVYLDGVIHWIASRIEGDDDGIGCFYVGDERFEFDSLIPEMLPVWNECIDVGVLGGCLSVVNYSTQHFAEIWILTSFFGNENDEGWTRVFVLPISDTVTLNFLCALRSGEILFLSNNNEIFCGDPFGDKARELGIKATILDKGKDAAAAADDDDDDDSGDDGGDDDDEDDDMAETIYAFAYIGSLVSPVMARRAEQESADKIREAIKDSEAGHNWERGCPFSIHEFVSNLYVGYPLFAYSWPKKRSAPR